MKIPITLPRHIWFAIFGIALLFALIWAALKSGPLAPIQVTVTQGAQVRAAADDAVARLVGNPLELEPKS